MSKHTLHETPTPADTQLSAAVNYPLKIILALLAAATIWSSFYGVSRQYFGDRLTLCLVPLSASYARLDDCRRLGVVWPTLNLFLSILLPAGQFVALATKRRKGRVRLPCIGDTPSALTVGAAVDTEINLRSAVVATSLAAVVAALAFTRLSRQSPLGVQSYQLVYWRSSMAFWQVFLLTCSHDLLDFMACSSERRWPPVRRSVVAVVLLQLAVCALIEPAFTVLGPTLGSLDIMGLFLSSLHARFVLVSAMTASAVALCTVRAYRWHRLWKNESSA